MTAVNGRVGHFLPFRHRLEYVGPSGQYMCEWRWFAST